MPQRYPQQFRDRAIRMVTDRLEQDDAPSRYVVTQEIARKLGLVEKAVEQVAGEASVTMTANLDASNERAEQIIAATAKLEARQLWSAAAAMCLALLPVVVVVAGLWMGISGLITGAQWALDVDGNVWLAVGAGLAGSGYGLFASTRWVAGLVETWRGRGMPTWPSWRKR